MPDTGAPWNIPYVASTDLVSDWPADSLALANAIDAGLDAAGNAGIGSNVVSTTKTDVFSASVAQGAVTPITGMSATITPTSNTAKILVIASLVVSSNQAQGVAVTLKRGATAISIADAASNRRRQTGGGGAPQNRALPVANILYLDSPATTSATTYSFDIGHNDTSSKFCYLNRSNTDGDFDYTARATSTITLIEVAP